MCRRRANCSYAVGLLLLAAVFTGCNDGSGSGGNIGGFFVHTVDQMVIGGVPTPPTPHGNILVTGSWIRDLSSNAAGQELSFDVVTDGDGNAHVLDGRIPAVWETGVVWDVPCGGTTVASAIANVTQENPNIDWACINETAAASPAFALANSSPSTIAIQLSGLSSTNGMPQLKVYGQSGLASQGFASSVSTDGTTAIFNFPVSSSGGPLTSGLYGFSLWNQSSPGVSHDVGVGILSIGSNNTALTTPYGIDAYDVGTGTESCVVSSASGTSCTTSNAAVTPNYVVTLSTPGKLCRGQSPCVGAGSQPTAVKAYNSTTTESNYSSQCYVNYVDYSYYCSIGYTYYTAPQNAIVANYGSNNVSIINLSTMAVAAITIPVGVEPVAVLVSPDQTKAFVANYGSNTISEINLSTNSVVATLAVGLAPDTLALDPSGNYLWVAGLNYISEVSLSSFTIVSTSPMNGQVTALGISGGQNEWVYTTVSTDLSAFRSQDAVITTGSPVVHSEAQISTAGTFYTLGGGGSSTPPPYLKAGAVVSKSYSNGIAVTSSPTGFVVLDLVAHKQIMQGTTPTPVRSIATDPAEGVAYLTAPESNSLITVPLPPLEPSMH